MTMLVVASGLGLAHDGPAKADSIAQHIHQPVDHLADGHRPLVAAPLGTGTLRLDQRPFLVRQVARVTQTAPVITGTGLVGPYRDAPANRLRPSQNHNRPDEFDMFVDRQSFF
jgi:hypothetical protein